MIQLLESVLEDAGYLLLPEPLIVGGVPFSFRHCHANSRRSLDLLIVVDGSETVDIGEARRVRRLARYLDSIGSRLSLNALVIYADNIPQELIEDLSLVARTVSVKATDTAEAMLLGLGPLLPVVLPRPLPRISDSAQALDDLRSRSRRPELAALLLEASASSADKVSETYVALLDESFQLTGEGT